VASVAFRAAHWEPKAVIQFLAPSHQTAVVEEIKTYLTQARTKMAVVVAVRLRVVVLVQLLQEQEPQIKVTVAVQPRTQLRKAAAVAVVQVQSAQTQPQSAVQTAAMVLQWQSLDRPSLTLAAVAVVMVQTKFRPLAAQAARAAQVAVVTAVRLTQEPLQQMEQKIWAAVAVAEVMRKTLKCLWLVVTAGLALSC
jgi:hypothetical protein